MRLTIDRAELLPPLQRIQGVVGSRTSMPILANCLLAAGEGGLSVVATNLEIGLRDRVAAEVEAPGRVCVAAKKLFEVVRELPEGEPVALEVVEERLTVRAGRTVTRLLGLPPEEFPALPEVDEGSGVTLPAETLARLLGQVAFAMSTDITRQTLGGVLFAYDGEGHLEAVATDGHRLALRRLEVEGGGEPFREIVPRKAVSEVRRLVEEGETPVEIRFAEKQALVRRGPLALVTRLIEGRFPEYQRAIPTTGKSLVVVDREAFARACRRVAVLAHEKTHQVELVVEPGQMVILTQNPELGEAREELEVALEGEPVHISFNAAYILDILNAMQGETVRLEMSGSGNPALFTEAEAADYLCVLMPMRL